MNRRLFFGTILGAFTVAKLAPVKALYGSTGGAHVGAIRGALERERLARAIQVARWKWGVLGEHSNAPTFRAPDPFDNRDFIAYERGEWWRNVHTDDPAVRVKAPIDEDVALRILGVDPVEATKSLMEA